MEFNDSCSKDNKTTCNLFAQFFKSNYNYVSIENNIVNEINHQLDFDCFSLTDQEVSDGLNNLDINKNAGVDLIPQILLSKCAGSLLKILKIIFNKSLQTGIFLEEWKLSSISPIYKSGKNI